MAASLPDGLRYLKEFGIRESTDLLLEILDCAEEVINYVSPGSREHSLVVAALNGEVHEVQQLLAQGCDVNAYADPGCGGAATALWWAAVHGRVNVMKLLLQQETININEQCGDFGFTPLMAACAYGQVDAAKLLISKVRVGHSLWCVFFFHC
ncbi:unnamed protein product [Meganyctiphanes norvegica]|uniref:Uncharacterized protein n=1 Tax=Meganyctiphanes norvegica TaxID=48144 RepID=A0AAV2QC47_MEGNR